MREIASHPNLPQALLRSEAYPWRPAEIELIETHVSWVFLAGEFVVKVKRPVDLGFVDHTDPEVRRRSCVEEVRLNRRLTDGVYLDVVGIMLERGSLVIDGFGPVVESATLMRRLPADAMLDRLLERKSAPADLADRLAARLIPFHQSGAPVLSPDDFPVAAQLEIVSSNLDQLSEVAAGRVSRAELALVDAVLRKSIDAYRDLFVERARRGFVRDGHGDLRCEHVCLEDGQVQIFDCVEFSPGIRAADVASDLAFLLMDLTRLGAGDVATELLARYRDAGIELPEALLRFFAAHRALVRTKVECISRTTTPGMPEAEHARGGERHLHIALRNVTRAQPALIVMSGTSGTGKSTVASEIAAITGAEIIATDAVRKRLAQIQGVAASEWRTGIYTQAWTERTYARVLQEAERELARGVPVLLDGAFLLRRQRDAAARLAAKADVPMLLIETTCSEKTAIARLNARSARGDVRSDAGPAIHQAQRAEWAASPPGCPERAPLVEIDTEQNGLDQTDQLITALRDSGVLQLGIE